MPAYTFINDVIKPALYFLMIGLVFTVPLLAVWDWLLEMRQVQQEDVPQAEGQPVPEVTPQPALPAMSRGEREAEEIILRLLGSEVKRDE